MLAKERQNQIHKLLKANGAVTASDLVARFGTSLETIRRDLLAMEKAGLLTRVHGGAVTPTNMVSCQSLADRNQENSSKKMALARAAAALVNEGDYISIDTGSTPLHFARALKERLRSITVVTYSLSVFEELRGAPELKRILLGGQYSPGENAFFGHVALDALDALHVQKAFIFPMAVSLEQGICNCGESFLPLQQKMLRQCDQAYILADSSKFSRTALHKVADMRQEYIYVTDDDLPEALQHLYKDNGLTVITGKK